MSDPAIGDKFGRLTVVGPSFRFKKYRKTPVRCECGVEKDVYKHCLLCGHSQSCGCLQRERSSDNARKLFTTHNKTDTPLYTVWSSMKARCYKPKCKEFPLYGARGISVCDEWKDSFAVFHEWATKNGHQVGLQIDRIDNDGNYAPENCRFVTPSRNCRNRRCTRMLAAFGETKSLADWADDPRCVVSYDAVHQRLGKMGWDLEKALTTRNLRA